MENPPLADAVDLLSVGLIAFIAWRLGKLRWFVRIPLGALLGWPIITAGVGLHWHILWLAAGTPEEQAWVAASDSGPLVMSVVFGWAYALVVVLATEAVRAFILGVRRASLSRRRTEPSNQDDA
jgi:hypothetical protein